MIHGIRLRASFSFGEIYRHVAHIKELRTGVLNERPYLVERGQLSQEQLREIDGHEKMLATGWVLWDEFLMKTFIKTAQGNFSGHFYGQRIEVAPPAIKEKKWDLLFCDIDSSLVEIFSPSAEIIEAIKNVFQFDAIEYPGTLGQNFDEG